jgi:hypothetical protein
LDEVTATVKGRRQLLQRALAMLLTVGTASGAKAASCASPQGSDASLRASLQKGDCGSCMIFSASANVNGHCDSWSARS